MLFSINISYYLGLHSDNSLHSFPLSGLFILNEVFGVLWVFNEASKELYIELFPYAATVLGFAAQEGVLVLMSRDRSPNPYIGRAP